MKRHPTNSKTIKQQEGDKQAGGGRVRKRMTMTIIQGTNEKDEEDTRTTMRSKEDREPRGSDDVEDGDNDTQRAGRGGNEQAPRKY